MASKLKSALLALALLTASPAIADIATNVVSVGTGATLIAADRSGRASITIVNPSQAVGLCVGKSSAATPLSVANGVCLPAIAGSSITLNTAVAIYGVWTDGLTHSVSFIETY